MTKVPEQFTERVNDKIKSVELAALSVILFREGKLSASAIRVLVEFAHLARKSNQIFPSHKYRKKMNINPDVFLRACRELVKKGYIAEYERGKYGLRKYRLIFSINLAEERLEFDKDKAKRVDNLSTLNLLTKSMDITVPTMCTISNNNLTDRKDNKVVDPLYLAAYFDKLNGQNPPIDIQPTVYTPETFAQIAAIAGAKYEDFTTFLQTISRIPIELRGQLGSSIYKYYKGAEDKKAYCLLAWYMLHENQHKHPLLNMLKLKGNWYSDTSVKFGQMLSKIPYIRENIGMIMTNVNKLPSYHNYDNAADAVYSYYKQGLKIDKQKQYKKAN